MTPLLFADKQAIDRASMQSRVLLVDSRNIDGISCPPGEQATLAWKLMAHYVSHGTKRYIDNMDHEVLLAIISGHVVPIVINNGHDSDCVLTSPYTNYISYAGDFVRSMRRGGIRTMLRALIRCLQLVIRPNHLDRVIYVNHWLLATGPALSLSLDELQELLCVLRTKYPGYAYVVKRLQAASLPKDWAGRSVRGDRIFRQNVYIWKDGQTNGSGPSRNFRQDRRLLTQNLDRVNRVTDGDSIAMRLEELYRNIYVVKYSHFSAHLTQEWFEQVIRTGALEIYTINTDDNPNYFMSCCSTATELISSVLGSIPSVAKRDGLHRMGMSYLMLLAGTRHKCLNMSGGSGEFKLKRDARPESEYDVLFGQSLSIGRRISWKIVKILYNLVAPRLFRALRI